MGLRAASASVTDRQPRLTGALTRPEGSTMAMDQPEAAVTSNNSTDDDVDGPVRWAGVDWSWSEHAICVIDDAGAAAERETVKHSAAGLAKLHRHNVRGVANERGDGPVVQALLDAGLTVFVIASRQVTALRSRYGTAGNKDDRFDAYLLADVLRTDRHRLTPLTTDTPTTVGLRMLIRARADLVKARVMAHNQLRAHLLSAFPGGVGLFHQLDGKISLAFLQRFPTPRRARWLSEKRLAAWLHAAHYTRPTTRTPAQLFDHLCQAPAGLPDGPAADAAETITLERNLGEPCFLVPRRRRGPVCVNKL
jgi:transposase